MGLVDLEKWEIEFRRKKKTNIQSWKYEKMSKGDAARGWDVLNPSWYYATLAFIFFFHASRELFV